MCLFKGPAKPSQAIVHVGHVYCSACLPVNARCLGCGIPWYFQYDAALKTFNEAKKQKVKDNFSKVQRKNVERWVVTAVEGTKKIR